MIIKSFVDNDLYKFTMQECILFGSYGGVPLSEVKVTYTLKLRTAVKFPLGFRDAFYHELEQFRTLRLTEEQLAFLKRRCPFLRQAYLDILSKYEFDPSEVSLSQFEDGTITLTVHGYWWRTVLWEVPLMALISELYYRLTEKPPQGNWCQVIVDKIQHMTDAGVHLSEFGTRRRHSAAVQEQVVATCKFIMGKQFLGTSNVHQAFIHDVQPQGTNAHELFSVIAALFGYRMANQIVLELWSHEYGGSLGIALADTFTSKVFFRDAFTMKYAKLYDGVRQDSGDPVTFREELAIPHYKSMGIDPLSKILFHSDNLNVRKAIDLTLGSVGKIKCSIGMGTHLTNDVGWDHLNMVIKATQVHWKGRSFHCVKLSDDPGKNSGDQGEIVICKSSLGVE